jgi:excisionase family DNA binding protein
MAQVIFQSNDIVNVSYAATKLNVSRMTIYRWVKEGKILAVKFGKSTFIPKSEIERLKEK